MSLGKTMDNNTIHGGLLFRLIQGVLELQKAQRVARQEEGWEKAREKLQRVVDLTLKYCEGQTLDHNDCSLLTRDINFFPACRQVCGAGGRGQLQRLSSARLALQGVISKTKVYRHTPVILLCAVVHVCHAQLMSSIGP